MAASGGRRRRLPQISVQASTSGMRAQRVGSSSGGGGGGNALVSFAQRGHSSSPSQLSEFDFPRGLSDLQGESRATTAPGADGLGSGGGSVFRSRVSVNFRQALAEAKERSATHRLTAQTIREQRRSNNHQQQDSVSRLDGNTLVEEDDDDFDTDSVFDDATKAAAATASSAVPQDAEVVSDPRRRRALRRWGLVRDIIDDVHRERHAKKTEGWSMFFKHVRAMSEAEKTRQDLYDRYNTFGDGKSDFMTSLPAIPDELLLAAGIPLPSTRSRRLGFANKGGRPPRR